MEQHQNAPIKQASIKSLPRNVWAVGFTSLFMDISSEMVLNILPLFLANVLGIQTSIIGLIEGLAEATSSLLKMFSGWLSDKLGGRKWLAVAGYGLSAITKPFFYFASSWGIVAGIRWIDRVGKGIRTAPRDALVADSVSAEVRGLAFGFHRAMDTAGAMIGLIIAALVVWFSQSNAEWITRNTFQLIVLASLIPAFLAVFSLIIGAKETSIRNKRDLPKIDLRHLGKPFQIFLVIVSIFTLGNSSDAFLVLRAQNLGISVVGILLMLISFNLIYTLISTPAGRLSDKIGRKRLIVGGWLVYALMYLGFGLASRGWQVWLLYGVYGLYYGMAYGSANALVADLVPEQLRGTAYGTYNAIIGIIAFPSSLIAGILWEKISPAAPFLFGSGLALVAALMMVLWMPSHSEKKVNLPA